jgi:O-antigen/teichoic acid export membrane protein
MQKSLTLKVGILAFANASQKGIMLVIAMILSRYLIVEDYGTYQQLIMIYSTLITIISFGLPSSINYFLPRTELKGERKAYVIQTYILLLVLGFLFSIAFFFLSGFISKQFNNPELTGLIKIFIWFVFFLTPIQFINQLLVVLDKTKKLAVYRISMTLLRLISVVLPILLGLGLRAIIISLFCFSFVNFIISTFIIFRPFTCVRSLWRKSFIRSQLKYSSYIGLSSVMGMLIKSIDKIMISLFFIPSTFAIYANGARELPFIGILTGSVMAILVPEFVKLYKENKIKTILKLWQKSMIKVALILFPITVFLILFTEEFMTLLFSVKYSNSANIFRVYLLLVPLKIAQYGPILMSINKTKLIFRISCLALVLNIILNLFFVKIFGVIGPAIASLFSMVILILLMILEIKKELCLSNDSLFPWKELRKILLVCFVPFLILAPFKLINWILPFKFALVGLLYFLIYGILIFSIFKSHSKRLLEFLKKR